MAQLARITDANAVWKAIDQYCVLGQKDFLSKYGVGPARRYVVLARGRQIDAKALVAAAYGLQYPDDGPLAATEFSGGERGANAVLERLGFTVLDLRLWTVADERLWRRQALEELNSQASDGAVEPGLIRELGVYGGQQGIWVDKDRTAVLSPDGVAVSVLHRGEHYPDDLDDEALIYHYPSTNRPPARDAGEIGAVKAADQLGLPIFVISEAGRAGQMRLVREGSVVDFDDRTETFLIDLAGTSAGMPISKREPEPDSAFIPTGPRPKSRTEVEKAKRDRRFKFRVTKGYAGRCVLSGIAVPEMLEAAHVIPVEAGGTDDPRNGLLLTAGLHRAFDAGLWAINPETLEILVRAKGPTRQEMGIAIDRIEPSGPCPAREALEWRFERFLKGVGS